LAPRLRTDGAGLINLTRNIGSAVGVSLTTTVLANGDTLSLTSLPGGTIVRPAKDCQTRSW